MTPDAKRDLLAKVSLFSGLSPEELGKLVEVSHTKRVKARQEVFHKGDTGSQVYAIMSGKVRCVAPSADGKEVVFDIMNPGEVFGEMALLDGGERSASIEAIEDCELLVLDRRDFLPFVERHPKVAIKLLEAMTARVRNVSELVEDTLFLNLPSRLAKKLLSLAETYGTDGPDGVRIDLKLSQQELGNLVGTTRESINKQIKVWEEQGLIERARGFITLVKRDELEARAELVL